MQTLAELHTQNLERAKVDRDLAFSTYPEILNPVLFLPCTVKILMVTDAGGSFTDADFGLTELLDVLSVSPGPYVRFAVTKAHRLPGAVNADIPNFRFDTTDLSYYDQIWMIAVGRTGDHPVSDSELRAISQFMDGGGGVFATGDHEDLGAAICARIPRVRSMRKWYWPNAGPNGEPVAPGGGDHTRLDTNRSGHDAALTFDDQSDDVPQSISPVIHSVPSPYLFQRSFGPHPLLCGPRGTIRVLPDHPHEGECYVPADRSKSFTFGGYTTQEYPNQPDGTGLAPEVVSYSHSSAGITDAMKQTASVRSFAANCAYDGHRAGVGRVSVESTWHHLFNINLKGVPGNPDPIKRHAYHASAAGMAKYEDIKAYFRNIGVWLARPQTQHCMRWRTIWAVRWDSRMFMDLRPVKELKELDLQEMLRIGLVARDVLNRYASRCITSYWIFQWLQEIPLRIPVELVQPWPPRPDPPVERLDPVLYYFSQAMVEAALGALIYSVALRYPEVSQDDRERLTREPPRELMNEAAKVAEERVLEKMRESLEAGIRLLQH